MTRAQQCINGKCGNMTTDPSARCHLHRSPIASSGDADMNLPKPPPLGPLDPDSTKVPTELQAESPTPKVVAPWNAGLNQTMARAMQDEGVRWATVAPYIDVLDRCPGNTLECKGLIRIARAGIRPEVMREWADVLGSNSEADTTAPRISPIPSGNPLISLSIRIAKLTDGKDAIPLNAMVEVTVEMLHTDLDALKAAYAQCGDLTTAMVLVRLSS